jgi:hypothetical protein
LDGRVGTFLLPDPMNRLPRGAASEVPSSPVVDGSGQIGSRLKVRNAPPSLPGWLSSGNSLQAGPNARCQLLKVLSVTDTDPTGRAVIDVWPALRGTLVDGDAISLADPAGLFALEEDYSYLIEAPFDYEVRILCAEAF